MIVVDRERVVRTLTRAFWINIVAAAFNGAACLMPGRFRWMNWLNVVLMLTSIVCAAGMAYRIKQVRHGWHRH